MAPTLETTAQSAALKSDQPALETERLILRPFAASDAGDLQRWVGNFEVADTTLNIPHPYPDGAAEKFIAAQPGMYARKEAVLFALTFKSDGRLMGGMGIHVMKKHHRGELGYWIARPFWNQGYATEAGRAVLEFGWTHWSLHKIDATHLVRNPASGRVMEKIGMVQEGILREHVLKWDRFEDVATWASLSPYRFTAPSGSAGSGSGGSRGSAAGPASTA
jgi:ribosomal-protein-alanine N-acetyltransferase